jgi:DNA-binding MurR/RpiR family transcriptional regulator
MIISTLIAEAGNRLTPTERVLAEAVLEDPTLLAFGTVSDLAERSGASRPSVVRFATKLGFEGYADLQEQVRADLTQRLSRPSQRIRLEDEAPAPRRQALEAACASAFAALEGDRLASLATPIVQAENVWILSGETSRAGAHAFHSGLKIVRPGVHWVAEHSVGGDLSGAGPGDTAVVFDFARYRRQCIAAARALSEGGVQLVAVTDGPLSPLASLTDTWCGLDVPAIGPFDSSVPAVIVAELLVAEAASQLRDEARERIDRTEALWKATGTFHL